MDKTRSGSEAADRLGDSAVRTILDAEHAANRRVEAARESAARRVQQARDQAREIEQRAVERTREVQQMARAWCDRRIAALTAATDKRLAQGGDPSEPEAIDRDADRFARRLIGCGVDAAAECTIEPEARGESAGGE